MEYSEDEIFFVTQSKFREGSENVSTAAESGQLCGEFLQDTASDAELSQILDESEVAVGSQYEDKGRNADSSRFRAPKDDISMEEYSSRSLSAATKSKCKWAADLFEGWRLQRNSSAEVGSDISRIDVPLRKMTKDELCYCISRFLCEVRKTNGEEYPPATLYSLVISLQLYLEINGKSHKLLQEPEFLQLKNTLDHLMKERVQQGVVDRNRKAEIITLEEEDRLWASGVLGTDSPQKLVDTMLYLNGLQFALRAGKEHRDLRWTNPQITLQANQEGRPFLRYAEDCSKTNQGGLKHRSNRQKVVHAYEDGNRERCIVSTFLLYKKHCPPGTSAFYLRPLVKPKGDVWYTTQPIGKHTLAATVGRLCKAAGIPGFRTNHSLRATAATRLYHGAVDEQLITEITGHRSLAVREYKRTDDRQRQLSNSIVAGREKKEAHPSPKRLNSNSNCGPNITVNISVHHTSD